MKHKKLILTLGIIAAIIAVLGGIEVVGTYYYNQHFYPNTIFKGENISRMTIDEAYTQVSKNLDTYKLKITGQYTEDFINSKDIDLKYDQNNENGENIFQKLLDDQKSYLWFLYMKDQHNAEEKLNILFDDKKLKENVSSLSCFHPEEVVDPENACIIFDEKKQEYILQEEKVGNIPDIDRTTNSIVESVKTLEAEYIIPEEYYPQPDILSADDKLRSAFETVSKYMSAEITLKDRDGSLKIDKNVIKDFIKINADDYSVNIDEEALTSYINNNLDTEFDTLYKEFTFTSPVSGKMTMRSKTYGKVISTADELPKLLEEIKNGEIKERKPLYKKSQIEVSDENGGIGNNFIEVDVSDQKVYVIREGKVAFETSCVTGKNTSERKTPTGIFDVRLKAKNYTMKKYDAFVKYWINVYPEVGVGLHDASWRSKFGGTIYKSNGSHGCINLPLKAAKTIYEMCSYFEPVIIHE